MKNVSSFSAENWEPGKRPRVAAIVITKNEEAVIGRCLESVQWADEIILVDSGRSHRGDRA